LAVHTGVAGLDAAEVFAHAVERLRRTGEGGADGEDGRVLHCLAVVERRAVVAACHTAVGYGCDGGPGEERRGEDQTEERHDVV